jgi:hypothetical protein
MYVDSGNFRVQLYEIDGFLKILPYAKFVYSTNIDQLLVIGNETFEKLSAIGTLANLLVYLTTVFHIKSVTAVTMMNIFSGTTNMTPVLGAFLSDTYLGRYATIGFASIASLLVLYLLSFLFFFPFFSVSKGTFSFILNFGVQPMTAYCCSAFYICPLLPVGSDQLYTLLVLLSKI